MVSDEKSIGEKKNQCSTKAAALHDHVIRSLASVNKNGGLRGFPNGLRGFQTGSEVEGGKKTE